MNGFKNIEERYYTPKLEHLLVEHSATIVNPVILYKSLPNFICGCIRSKFSYMVHKEEFCKVSKLIKSTVCESGIEGKHYDHNIQKLKELEKSELHTYSLLLRITKFIFIRVETM